MHPFIYAPNEAFRVQDQLVRACTHSRVVDEIRDAQGGKTGRLVCLECHAEFPDPAGREPHH